MPTPRPTPRPIAVADDEEPLVLAVLVVAGDEEVGVAELDVALLETDEVTAAAAVILK